mgnify:CR=1 FL=1
MSLTPEELIALGKACKLAGFAPSASRPMGLFAAGIAHDLGRCAWQPIESAPQDGVGILAVSGNWIVTMHWHRNANCWADCGPSYARIPVDEQPTHWMPLPQPPQEAPADGGQLGE